MRIKLAVYVDLDPVPGQFHSADSARNTVASLLDNTIKHRNPMVSIESYDTSKESKKIEYVVYSQDEAKKIEYHSALCGISVNGTCSCLGKIEKVTKSH